MNQAPETLTLLDGDTGEILRVDPWDQVPEANRLVYFRDGVRLNAPEEGAQAVPVVRTVRFSRNAQGKAVAVAEATRIHIQEFDAEGRMLRETLLKRGAPKRTE